MADGLRKDAWIKLRVKLVDRQRLVENATRAGKSLSDYLRERGLAS